MAEDVIQGETSDWTTKFSGVKNEVWILEIKF